WYKDMRHSTRVSDAEGHPAFALVNKATGLAVKHSLGQSHPVKLIPYNPEYLDESLEDPALGRRRRVRVRVRRRLVGRPGSLRASACVRRRLPPPAGRRGGLPAAACPRRRGVRAAGRRVRVRQPAPCAGVRVHRARSVRGRRGLQPDREERHRVPRANQPQRRVPALGEGHEVQHQDQGRGGLPCVRPGEQDHRRSHQALPRTEPPCEACGLQPGVHGRVGAMDGEQGRGQGLPLRPHGEQHLPQLRRAARRQGPRRRPRRHRGRALGVVQGRQSALEDRPL
uniref:Uncharacterized protein n=1 Tax=Aegilops tauschii subsp. strangulata TaxID=200361 RepID=A0A453AN52_AEGTS